VDQLTLHLLGEFAVYRGDRRVELPPACQRVVALIALKRRPVHRLWVCATLWPQAPTRRAVASLRSATWRLRPLGVEPLLSVDPQYLQLGPDVSVDWHDALDLIGQLVQGEISAGLIADLLPLLRAGELLDRWSEPWVVNERASYHALRMRAYEALGYAVDKHVSHHRCGSIHTVHTPRDAVHTNRESDEWRQ
jgi:DNA-binding SARP family transcriptional activator